jgi:hypothetical protein
LSSDKTPGRARASDKAVGKDFEEGLSNLKQQLENS